MKMTMVLKALGPIDGRNIRRDSMLRWLLLGPLVIGLIFRYLLPWAADSLVRRFGFDLRPYFPMLYAYLVLVSPVLYGVIIGFLLLDERDDKTLVALQVTPLTLTNYVSYRIGLPLLISIAITPITLWLAGIEMLNVGQMLLIALVAAPLAPIYTLFLAVFSPNKVQGFAIMKGSGIFLAAPLLAWFVAMPLQLLFGLFPTYWPIKLFWLALENEPGLWWYALIGLLFQLVLVYGLLKRFNQVMYRGV